MFIKIPISLNLHSTIYQYGHVNYTMLLADNKMLLVGWEKITTRGEIKDVSKGNPVCFPVQPEKIREMGVGGDLHKATQKL
ncbi:hypothetical protein [Desulforamulus reducens]|uniref:hypothetical protein n=1 Tax=Desulforamulus reducens TaxID=59610 RepID=UPI00059D63F7|nr:hypothetical protein [Desulforamulus reducens]